MLQRVVANWVVLAGDGMRLGYHNRRRQGARKAEMQGNLAVYDADLRRMLPFGGTSVLVFGRAL
jgi:hypothetical protein